MLDRDYDANVIGARIAGSTVAALLGDAGYHVLLVDKAIFPTTTRSTHFFSNEGLVAVLETTAESTRPLESERWAASIDTVGGATLAYLMQTTKKGGAIAAICVSGGAAFHATVYPLILRGIKVLGIDMPSTPLQMRRELWEEVMREEALLSLADAIASEVRLEDIPRVTQAMLGGQTRGRILVRPGEQ